MAQETISQLHGRTGSYPSQDLVDRVPEEDCLFHPFKFPKTKDLMGLIYHSNNLARRRFWFPLCTVLIFGSETNSLLS